MKLTSGKSYDDAISFASTKHQVTLHDNCVCKYESLIPCDDELEKQFEKELDKEKQLEKKTTKEIMVKNRFLRNVLTMRRKLAKKIKDSNLKDYFSFKYIMKVPQISFLIWEIILMIIMKKINYSLFSITLEAVALTFGVYYIIKALMNFIPNHKIRKNHAAEHMAFNCYVNNKELTYENILKESKYSNRCGSVKIANYIFLELINLIMVVLFNVWIPHMIIVYVVMNLRIAIPGNFIARLYQLGLTEKPDKANILLAQRALIILKNTESVGDSGVIINPTIFQLIIKATFENKKT